MDDGQRKQNVLAGRAEGHGAAGLMFLSGQNAEDVSPGEGNEEVQKHGENLLLRGLYGVGKLNADTCDHCNDDEDGNATEDLWSNTKKLK